MPLSPRDARRLSFAIRVCLLSALFLVVSSSAVKGEARFPIKVTRVQIGLPPGPSSKQLDENNQAQYLFKAATWAPVWIELECSEAIEQETIEISVDTPDGDDVIGSSRIIVPAPRLGKTVSFEHGRLPYVKPGGIFTEVTVNIRGGTSGKQLAETYQQRLTGLPPSRYVILSVGSSLPGLRLTKTEGQSAEGANPNEPLRGGWVELAQITQASDLPDQWIGYAGVDLMILTTSADRSFFAALANDRQRRKALSEWVRRGGRIIISAGAHADVINALPELKEMLPANLPASGANRVSEIAMILPNSPRMLLRPKTTEKIALQSLAPVRERPYQAKLLADERDNPAPLVVQSPYGLGRVTLVAFDLELPALEEWRFREMFWEWLINTSAAHLPSGNEHLSTDPRNDDEEDRYLTRMQNNLEFFEGVPVVSFGWVALLILLYILLIGPIEYIILKRLFKRLEWTWATFPVIVITVCAATYFTANQIKSHELKVNKVDLVDVDLASNRVYGSTWFTLFSPQIQNYTIGVEPFGPRSDNPSATTWTADDVEHSLAGTVVSWHGKAKSNRQSLFRRTYQYRSEPGTDGSSQPSFASAIERVPIQVWSTKSFSASWAGRMDPSKSLFESTLRIANADPAQITGSITCNLPVETLADAQLIYREHITPLPLMLPGMPRYLSTNAQAVGASSWMQSANTHKDLIPNMRSARGNRAENEDDPTFRLWPVLFHDLTVGQFGRLYNASVRPLDQSWRVTEKSPNQAILLARIGRAMGPAEAMSVPARAPTRLWLSEIPGDRPRTPLQGTIRQETYIRVFIPILPARE